MEKINKIEEVDNFKAIQQVVNNHKNLCYKCKQKPIWKICLCEECYNKLIGEAK